MIDVLSRWRRGEEESLCSDSSSTPEPDYNADVLYSGIPRSDIRALKEALQFLRGRPRSGRRSHGTGEKVAANNVTWCGRLRPRSRAQENSRQPRTSENSHRVVKLGESKPLTRRRPISRAGKASDFQKPPIPSTDPGLHSLDRMPQAKSSVVKPRRTAKARHSSKRIEKEDIHNSMQGVKKTRKIKSKSSKRPKSGSDKHRRELLRLLTPPESK